VWVGWVGGGVLLVVCLEVGMEMGRFVGRGEGRGGMDVKGRGRDICRASCSDSLNEHLKQRGRVQGTYSQGLVTAKYIARGVDGSKT